MGKTIVLGDTHGRSWWKLISQMEKWDKMVLIGDYFDSFNIDGQTQINNFRYIIQFKKDNVDKVILLIGNHDYHYTMMEYGEKYSGFQKGFAYTIRELLGQNYPYMQICYIEDKYLFTHAGVTKTWLDTYKDSLGDHPMALDEFINLLFTYKPLAFKFQGRDDSGDDVTQSPIWVRPQSLAKDKLDNYTHVVGHTSVKKINCDTDSGIVLIDALESHQYLSITDGIMKVETI